MKKTLLIIIILLVALAAFLLWPANKERVVVTSFQECLEAGNAVMESYPRRCRAGEETFTEYIGNELEKTDLIRISSPRPNQKITSPLVISGEARGFWFFEADFPVELFDSDGNSLGVAIARAESDWMTEGFVPFRAEISFSAQEGEGGELILKKDNPSDLRELDDELVVPVKF